MPLLDDQENLKPRNGKENNRGIVHQLKVLRGENSKENPGVNTDHKSLAVYQWKRVVLILGHCVELGLEFV